MVTVPHIMVGFENMLDYRGVGLERFHCMYISCTCTYVPCTDPLATSRGMLSIKAYRLSDWLLDCILNEADFTPERYLLTYRLMYVVYIVVNACLTS